MRLHSYPINRCAAAIACSSGGAAASRRSASWAISTSTLALMPRVCFGASGRVPAAKAERPLSVQSTDLRGDVGQRARLADFSRSREPDRAAGGPEARDSRYSGPTGLRPVPARPAAPLPPSDQNGRPFRCVSYFTLRLRWAEISWRCIIN
jgi:hypothetical protein